MFVPNISRQISCFKKELWRGGEGAGGGGGEGLGGGGGAGGGLRFIEQSTPHFVLFPRAMYVIEKEKRVEKWTDGVVGVKGKLSLITKD
jgi:hypothetical protein